VEWHRRASVIAATGWTPDQLDEQDTDEVDRLLRYLNVREGVKRQYRSMRE
jgi:hypothetical protein